MAKISIIVPIYGVEKYIYEAINSIINQTLKDIEIILINDGSKDNCAQIIDKFSKIDSRISVIHKENSGYGNTCNLGLDKANGEYIAILEPDDFVKDNMYENLYEIAKKYDSDIVKSAFYENLQFGIKTRIKKVKWDLVNKIPENKTFTINEHPEFFYYHPSIWSCIYKREFLNRNNIRFVEAKGSGWVDNLFQVQTLILAKKINYTSEAYYFWRRLNKNPSYDLNDYKIPFIRSDEIHNWLNCNKINDKNLLANIYKRELAYINTVLGMKHIFDIKDCYKQIKCMCKRMDLNIIFKSGILKGREKFNFIKCYLFPKILYLEIRIKTFIKYLANNYLKKRQKNIETKSKTNNENYNIIMKDAPLVSVVLPVYNGEELINKAIESIINQTYKNWELIIVDDCSTDNTNKIIKEFANRDNRIKIIENKVNLKLPSSLNVGFKIAKGKYYTWTSDDNEYYPEAFSKMVGFLENNSEYGMVYCAINVEKDGKLQDYLWCNIEVTPQLLLQISIPGACFMYKSSVAKTIGPYNEKMFLNEDHDYWLKMMMETKIGNINNILYLYRLRQNSLTNKRKREIEIGKIKLFRKYLKIYSKLFPNINDIYRDEILFNKYLENEVDWRVVLKNVKKSKLYKMLKKEYFYIDQDNKYIKMIIFLGGIYILKGIKLWVKTQKYIN